MRNRAAFFLLFLLASLLPAAAAGAEEPYSQEKCSLCHIRQSVFFDPKFAGQENIREFGEERACGSCHNGTVRDSRALLWRGAQHPAPGGKEKPDRPCSRCHSPHSKGGWDVLAGTAVSLRKGGDPLCTGCHKELSSRTLHAAGIIAEGCRECHRAHGGVGKALLRESKAATCLRCHPNLDPGKTGGHPVARAAGAAGDDKVLPECTGCHPPHGTGKGTDVALSQCSGCHAYAQQASGDKEAGHPGRRNCLACHSFHQKSREDGRAFRGREIRPEILCGKCHENRVAVSAKSGKEKGTHVTLLPGGKEGICFRCHRIHKAATETGLLATDKAYSCLGCHEEQNTIRETSGISLAHPVFERVGKGRLGGIAVSKQRPIGSLGEIVCRTCHSVHGAAPRTPLLAKGSEGGEICFWCHGELRGARHNLPGKTTKSVTVACETCHPVHGKRSLGENPWQTVCTECHPRKSQHLLGVDDRSTNRPKDLPVFDLRGRKVTYGAISCPTCHEPHGTEGREKRLRKAYYPSGFLCTSCHRREEDVALTPHDLRGIIGKSICEPCHVPHQGAPPLMAGIHVDGVGTGAEMCRGCHKESKGLGSPIPKAGHPSGIVVPRPLPEIYPLFGVAGEEVRGGILTCATCHEVHGTGMLPSGKGTGKLLRLPKDEADRTEPDGNRPCVPCHAGKETAHGKAACQGCHPPHGEVNSRQTCAACHPREWQIATERHAAAGKGCDACHKVHAERTGDSSETRCTGCHPRTARIAGSPHAALGEGACRPCHPIHEPGNGAPARLRSGDDIFAPDRVCFRCHRPEGIAPLPELRDHPKRTRKVPTNYGATVSLESAVTMAGRLKEEGRPLFPLYDESGIPSMSGQLACLSCHDPHAGSGVAPGKGPASPTRYLRDPSGDFLSEICTPCHKGGAGEHARKFHVLPRKTD